MRGIVSLGCLMLLGICASPRALAEPKKEDVPALIKELKSKSAKARVGAAEDLGHLGAVRANDVKDAVPALLEVLKKDRDPDVRRAAAVALGKVDPDPKLAVPVLTEALKDKKPAVRIAVAGALGQLGAEASEAVPALSEMQKDKDRAVSRAAGMALRNIRSRKP